MATLEASWVHGTSVQRQREGYFITTERCGFAAIFRTHGGEWFQFAIPTPVIVQSQRVALRKIFVLYKTEVTAKITAVHVYDAGQRIAAFDNLALAGDHSGQIDASSSWMINPSHAMAYGLGISVFVDFGPATMGAVPAIWFVTAGADFERP